jgi:hypothetical protein
MENRDIRLIRIEIKLSEQLPLHTTIPNLTKIYLVNFEDETWTYMVFPLCVLILESKFTKDSCSMMTVSQLFDASACELIMQVQNSILCILRK